MLYGVHEFHAHRIPMDNFIFKITVIGRETGSSSTETKFRIFHYRCSVSYTIKKMGEMIQVLIIICRRSEHRVRFGRRRCSLIGEPRRKSPLALAVGLLAVISFGAHRSANIDADRT